jgi:exodeoxyribonuclease VII small subunit
MPESSALPFASWEAALSSGEFEEAYEALEAIVSALESGGLRLADAVRCFEIGTELTRKCEQLLSEAELRITRLDEPAEQEPSPEPIPLFPRGPAE